MQAHSRNFVGHRALGSSLFALPGTLAFSSKLFISAVVFGAHVLARIVCLGFGMLFPCCDVVVGWQRVVQKGGVAISP
jgi:hypothetical protein